MKGSACASNITRQSMRKVNAHAAVLPREVHRKVYARPEGDQPAERQAEDRRQLRDLADAQTARGKPTATVPEGTLAPAAQFRTPGMSSLRSHVLIHKSIWFMVAHLLHGIAYVDSKF